MDNVKFPLGTPVISNSSREFTQGQVTFSALLRESKPRTDNKRTMVVGGSEKCIQCLMLYYHPFQVYTQKFMALLLTLEIRPVSPVTFFFSSRSFCPYLCGTHPNDYKA